MVRLLDERDAQLRAQADAEAAAGGGGAGVFGGQTKPVGAVVKAKRIRGAGLAISHAHAEGDGPAGDAHEPKGDPS